MDRCANTEALNKYLSGEEQFEKIVDAFEADVLNIVQGIGALARGYKDYDLSETLKSFIVDMVTEELL